MNNTQLVNFKINNKNFLVESGITLIQACANVGVEIPRFCYHEKLSIAGNCRMCLVEISKPKSIKPAASCALPITSGIHIHTNTVMVKKARESVLEFLLINHPLDCPICDQGGECDLQDQTIVFGSDRGRFYDTKRAVADKECGPFIKTIMTRCIHCTRCVRFGNEIAGVDFLGTTGRGMHTEIGQYIKKLLNSEISGNIIDLCPVGALTSKPYAYMARSWELNKIETIDILDSLCSNIRIDFRGLEILRILPRLNENINEEWITDKTRFSFDAHNFQRLHLPLIKLNREHIAVSWEAVFSWVGFQLVERSIKKTIGVIGQLIDAETVLSLKLLLQKISSVEFLVENINQLNVDKRFNYLLNKSLLELEACDLFILIGFAPRLELPLMNLRIRKAVKNKGATLLSFGYFTLTTYNVYNSTNNLNELLNLFEGRSFLCRRFLKSISPVILCGMNILKRVDSCQLTSTINFFLQKFFNKKYNYGLFNLILTNVGAINSSEIGLLNFNVNNLIVQNFKYDPATTLVYILESMDLRLLVSNFFLRSFKIFQGHHGSIYAELADVVFPGCTFVESSKTFLNIEGRVQHTKFVKNPPGLVRSDWKIILTLAGFLGYSLNIKNLVELRSKLSELSSLFTAFSYLNRDCVIVSSNNSSIIKKISKNSFNSIVIDYYLTDPLSKMSILMQKSSSQLLLKYNFNNSLKI